MQSLLLQICNATHLQVYIAVRRRCSEILTKRGGEINTMNAVQVVQQANKAYNAHDADALAAAYAEGATYSDSRDGQVFTGERIANYAKAVWAAYPDASVELITVADTGGGLVAAQWVLRGTTPTGRTVSLPGASFTQVEGDTIRSEQTYFDRQDLLEQLGLKVRATYRQ